MSSQNVSILMYGSFANDELASSYKRAFERLGHKVVPFDIQKKGKYLAPWLRHRVGHRLTIRSLALRRLGSVRWNEHLLRVGLEIKPQLLFVFNGELLMPGTLRTFRQMGTLAFIFHADNPFPSYYNHRPETLACAKESDCYFIWSRELVKRLKTIGVKRAEYLPFAWDPEVFPYKVWPNTEYDHDVVFIGGWDQKREWWLTLLAQSFDVKIWGPDYWGTRSHPNSPLRNSWQGTPVRGVEASRILRRSRIALNIIREQNMPDGVIMRTFELPGCGVFALSTRTEGALEILPEGRAGAYFSTIEECICQIDRYLSNDRLRTEIAQNAHAIVCHKHQYTHRVRQILRAYLELSQQVVQSG
jgi:spore maturation protein CgeB